MLVPIIKCYVEGHLTFKKQDQRGTRNDEILTYAERGKNIKEERGTRNKQISNSAERGMKKAKERGARNADST